MTAVAVVLHLRAGEHAVLERIALQPVRHARLGHAERREPAHDQLALRRAVEPQFEIAQPPVAVAVERRDHRRRVHGRCSASRIVSSGTARPVAPDTHSHASITLNGASLVSPPASRFGSSSGA